MASPRNTLAGIELCLEQPITDPLLQDLDDSTESLTAAGVVQQYTRTQMENVDQIVGVFRCDFESRQQRYALNIPIHPPLSEIPAVEAIGLDCDVRVRVTDRQKFGVRMEIVSNEDSDRAKHVYVDVVITSNI